jgi:AcrR family transcriptional regulator
MNLEEILKNLNEEKREKIINSAIDEFANLPYEKASTNNIVKNAGISKGLLFHYFGSKKVLYEKLVDFVLKKLTSEITSQIDWNETDIFERIKQTIFFKLRLSREYPKMFDFVYTILVNAKAKTAAEIIQVYEKHGVDTSSILADVYTKNIDLARFKDPEDIDKTINVIRWTLEKFSEEYTLAIENLSSFDYVAAASALDVYIDVLKKAFYK